MVDRIKGADLARVIACLAVFLHHLTFSVQATELPVFLQHARVVLEKGKFGVAVFFVLSGFLLGLPFWKRCDDGRMFQIGGYALMRMARIAPAAWVCFAVSLIVDLFYLKVGNNFTAIRFLAGIAFVSDWHWLTLFPVQSNGPLWSLSFEISAYAMMPMAFIMCRTFAEKTMRGWTARYLWSVVIFAALVLHALAVGVLPQTDIAIAAKYGASGTAAKWFPAYNAFGFFAMFAIGTLAAGIHTMVPVGSKVTEVVRGLIVLIGATLLPALAFAVIARQMNVPKPPFGFPTLPLIAAIFLYGVQHVRAGRLVDNQVIAFCAKISFGVYIWHLLALSFVTRFLLSYQINGTTRLFLIASTALGLTGLVSWGSYAFFEEPILNHARRLQEQWRTRQAGGDSSSSSPASLGSLRS